MQVQNQVTNLKTWHHIGEDRSYMEAMTHRRRVEIAAEKRSSFRPNRGLAASDLFLDTMLNQRIWEACPIDCTEVLCNIYENGSQICHSKGKTYRDAQLRELVHSIAVEHVPEHEVIWYSEPVPDTPNVEVILRHFHQYCPRAARCGS
jgi:hypothetical protein